MAIHSVDLHVATDFSSYPAGRDDHDGPYNGKKFREELLLPRYIEAKEKELELNVYFDGVKSFGSSFLEEAFGGLVRTENVDRGELMKRLNLHPGPPGNQRYVRAVERYITKARPN